MEHNKDEALRCIAIAQRYITESNLARAIKFTKKSITLYPTPQAESLLMQLEAESGKGDTASSNPKPSQRPSSQPTGATDTFTSARQTKTKEQPGLRQRTTEEPLKREYTTEQVEAVRRIHACGDDLYAVLGLTKTATEVEIKKSYRKLALQFHPDKNAAPGADEAFKLISKAFTVLSDSNKRTHYDQFGSEGSSMGGPGRAAGGRSPFGFSGAAGNPMFEQEISPEELFNMFFGGGGAGGGGPFFASSFGPGIRVQQFGGGSRPTGRRARNREPNRNSFTTTLFALLPLLFVLLPLITSLLSSLFFQAGSLYNAPEPEFRFSSTRLHPIRRHTQDYGIPYYINERDFDAAFKDNPRRLRQFERNVYIRYVHHLQEKCELEMDNKRRRIYKAQGWLGLMVDNDELKKAHALPLPSCDKLKQLK